MEHIYFTSVVTHLR